jgi:hypothetical protein
MKPDQAGGEDAAHFGDALRRCHHVWVEAVRAGGQITSLHLPTKIALTPFFGSRSGQIVCQCAATRTSAAENWWRAQAALPPLEPMVSLFR